ncbi:hypothetical protein PIB30_105590, partial [Stylosanthes scabra]|nr:hypothetical protein [Stylosanthes scabra]
CSREAPKLFTFKATKKAKRLGSRNGIEALSFTAICIDCVKVNSESIGEVSRFLGEAGLLLLE